MIAGTVKGPASPPSCRKSRGNPGAGPRMTMAKEQGDLKSSQQQGETWGGPKGSRAKE